MSRKTKVLLAIRNNKIVLLAIVLLWVCLLLWRVTRSGLDYCKNCNIVFITLTNLRYDHMSQNGYFRRTTPFLDALAEKSLVFDNTFSHSSWTLPEGISIFTSLYPYRHGVMDRYDGSVLSNSDITLADVLNENGYKTAAFTGGFDYDSKYGLTGRYGEYEECIDKTGNSTILQYGKLGCSLPKAINWIKNNRDSKFFVHVQGFDTHCPFSRNGGKTYDKDYKGDVNFSNCLWTFEKTEPINKNGVKYYSLYASLPSGRVPVLLSEKDVSHLVALYDESINQSDALIGSFLGQLKEMGIDDKTIIVFTSEHGDMLGKYGRFMRGGPLRGTFYDDVIHTPLLMKIPGIKPNRFNQLVEHVDIMPTILDILAIKKPLSLQGMSLLPVILAGKDIHQYVFAGSEYHPGIDNAYFSDSTRIESIRSKDWKLIIETDTSKTGTDPVRELYNLGEDKDETLNRVSDSMAKFDVLSRELNSWSEKLRRGK